MTTLPTSLKLDRFFADLVAPSGQKILQALGDSINALNVTDRMQDGYREDFSIPWNGHVQGVDSTSFWGYANRQGTFSDQGSGAGVNAVVSPRAPNYTGTAATILTDITGKIPTRWAETVWTVSPSVQGDNYALGQQVRRLGGRRSWLYRDAAQTVNARFIFFEHNRILPAFNLRGRRNTTNVGGPTAYTKPGSPSNQIVSLDVTCGASATADPNVICNGITGWSFGTADCLPVVGTRFRTDQVDGVQFQAISHGGFTTGDHIVNSTSAWTDAALTQYYTATGWPTHIVLWLGQNTNPGTFGLSEQGANGLDQGAGTNYQANLTSIIARHEALYTAAGQPLPKWLLVTQYRTGYNQTYYDTMAAVHQAIASVNERVSWVNLYRLAGGQSMDITTSFVLSDGVHPNSEGTRYFASLIMAEARRSLIDASAGGARFPIGFGF